VRGALETRKALLGHAHGDIATHYSAAEILELLNAAEQICDCVIAQTLVLFLLLGGKKDDVNSEVSEIRKWIKSNCVAKSI